jgi:UDP-GlcNAc:undecaprenyl-phosphate GlcNAc-1-phosphate transferase
MDGLALGLSSIALAFFVLATLDAGQPTLAALSAALLGATLGLYFYNASPARLFLGDSGAQLLGYALAAIGIAYVPAGAGLPQGVSWFTPILVLGVPIFDTTLVVVSRLRKRRPVYRAHQDHTYHRLVALGMHPSRSVLAMQLTAILLGLTAFIALNLSVLFANIVFGLVLGCGLMCLALLERAPADS